MLPVLSIDGLAGVAAAVDPPPPEPIDASAKMLEPLKECGKRVKTDSTVAPLSSEAFGEQVSPYNGSVEFVHEAYPHDESLYCFILSPSRAAETGNARMRRW